MGIWQQLSGHIATHLATYVTLTVVVAVLSAAASVAMFVRMRAITRPLSRVREGGEDAAQILAGVAASVEEAERVLDRLDADFRAHVEASTAFIRHVGLTRYDALPGIGGGQSFSLCLLDGGRNGVILTCLTGKNFTRSYAVTVAAGTPSRELGEEELRAMEEALSSETAVGV